MESAIKKYVSRYVVPFYFEYENSGYTKILEYFRKYDVNENKKLGLPKDCVWLERGFWENYKSDNASKSEMDIYTYLIRIFTEYPEDNEKFESNLGSSFVLKSNGALLNLQYDGSEKIGFKCTDLGLLIFRNGIGFIWYDISFTKDPSISNYIDFQNDFKELARTHSERFVKKTGKDSFEAFCLGQWLVDIINVERLGIRFWAERETTREDGSRNRVLPDKALLFQYLFVDRENETCGMDLAFKIANGYNNKYVSPKNLSDEIYEPFGNACFYLSKAGMAYVVLNSDSNETFFLDNFSCKFEGDYFFIYILLLYQTYSCAHYSRLLTKLPAVAERFEKDVKYVKKLESLDHQINLFLVKSVYESVSNIQHQNGLYKYGKRALALEEDIRSLTIGLSSLKEIESGKIQALVEEKEKKKERALNNGLIIFGFLIVVSAAVDAVNLVDWFGDHIYEMNFGHFFLLGFIAILTIFMFVVLIINTRKK